nr:DNA internalization-related competence protein ComEC/Rec2 [bacterium]
MKERLERAFFGLISRHLVLAAALYGMGLIIGSALYARGLSPYVAALISLACGVTAGVLRRGRALVPVLCGMAALGMCLSGGMWARIDGVAADDSSRLYRGCVLSCSEVEGASQTYSLTLSSITRLEGEREISVQGKVYAYCEDPFAIGDWVQIEGRLRPVRGYQNPGMLHARAQSAAYGIYAAIRVDSVERLPGQKGGLEVWAGRLRAHVAQVCSRLFPNSCGLMGALVVGDTANLEGAVYDAFRATGLLHLIVVSGMHVGIVLAGLWLLWRAAPLLPRVWMPAVLTAVLAVYCAMTGFSSSCIRAAIMAGLALWAVPLMRRPDLPTLLAAAFLLICIPRPERALSYGLWLSFLATLGLWSVGYWFRPLLARVPKGFKTLAGTLAASFSAQLYTWPILSMIGGNHPLLALALGTLIAPVISLLVMAGFPLLILGLLGEAMGQGVLAVVRTLAWPVDALASLTAGAMAQAVDIPGMAYAFALALPGIGLLFYGAALFVSSPLIRLKISARLRLGAAFLVACALVTGGTFALERAAPQIAMLDVGQGQCVLIRDGRGSTYLIDAGGDWFGGKTLDNTVTGAMRAMGVAGIDGVILTHTDEDHIRSLGALCAALPVGAVYLAPQANVPQKVACIEEVPLIRVSAMQDIPLGGGAALRLIPVGDMLCVRAQLSGCTALFTGDLTAKGEQALLQTGENLSCDVLQVAHHGSAGSSTQAFLDAASPTMAWISCGKDNRYGHPAPQTLDRLEKAGIAVCRTDVLGAIRLTRRFGAWRLSFQSTGAAFAGKGNLIQ